MVLHDEYPKAGEYNYVLSTLGHWIVQALKLNFVSLCRR